MNSELVSYFKSIIKYSTKENLLSEYYSHLQLSLENDKNNAGVFIPYSENYWLKQWQNRTSN